MFKVAVDKFSVLLRLKHGFINLIVLVSEQGRVHVGGDMYSTRLVLVRPAVSVYNASPLKHHATNRH